MCKHYKRTFFKKESKIEHEDSCDGGKYICVVCSHGFPTTTDLRKYIIEDEGYLMCLYCDKKFEKVQAIETHIKDYHVCHACGFEGNDKDMVDHFCDIPKKKHTDLGKKYFFV